ncbi:Os01g0813000, partial [Oryza sativa Japonica Group]
ILSVQTLAFRDISPQAPVHIIIIPKVKDGLSRLSKVLSFILSFKHRNGFYLVDSILNSSYVKFTVSYVPSSLE